MVVTPTHPERVTCESCRHFIGVITPDGRGPVMDDCNREPGETVARDECPMRAKAGVRVRKVERSV